MKIVIALLLSLVAVSCTSTNGVPEGATAWCGEFSYRGRITDSEAEGRALGVSDAAIADKMTAEDVIALADALGCSE